MNDDEGAVGSQSPRRRSAFRWLGHATVFLPGVPSVAVDPWRWRLADVADLVLVTSAHVDHCSEDDIAAARHGAAPIIAPSAAAKRLRSTFGEAVIALDAGESHVHEGISVLALPAEGPTRDGSPSGFLPRGAALSYCVDTPRARYLFLGDSIVLPEHEGHAADIAFVAVGGLVTATPEEAAETAGQLGAGLVVPVHWGDLEARFDAARRFVELCAERGIATELAAPQGSARDASDQG